ncbi:MAG TPA: response regulator [Catalimonadaceae bacterium]|nr:response regulator [Catalimonadaceae bacterium]HPI10885.1 response regulator [Catalimonadaceae bacterium]
MKKILIVEDERILAVSLKMDLEDAGFQDITMVTNCDDACLAVEEKKPVLVLMDISIQGEKTGIDTAILISGISPVPVIYLTGETDIETRRKAEETPNCKGYLTKPVKMEVLQPLLHEVLNSVV